MHRRDGARAELEPLVAHQPESRDRRAQQPEPHRHARPAREARRHVEVDDGECQYNRQEHQPHEDSLAEALFVLTTVADRDAGAALARALLERRLAACVNIGAPVESLYHWRGRIETGQRGALDDQDARIACMPRSRRDPRAARLRTARDRRRPGHARARRLTSRWIAEETHAR